MGNMILNVVQVVGWGLFVVVMLFAGIFAIGYFRAGTKYYQQQTVTRVPKQGSWSKAGPPKGSF